MIARRSVCATSKLELIDLIETGQDWDRIYLTEILAAESPPPAGKVSLCANIEILVTLSLVMVVMSILYLKEAGEKGRVKRYKCVM